MNRTKLLTITVIGLLLLNLGTLVFMFLQKPNGGPGLMNGHGNEGPKTIIIARLHFNITQQTLYGDMVDEHRSRSKDLHNQSRELHDELFKLLKEKTVDANKQQQLITEIEKNQRKLEELNFEHFLQIRSLCKGVQIAYFDELVDDLSRLFGPQHPPKK